MLPACRTGGEGCAIPTFDLGPSDVEGFREALWACQSTFHDCLARSEPRAHCFDYMVGQLRPLERKSIEPMALHVEGGIMRGMPRFISEVHGDEAPMRWHYHQLVAEELGEPDGVLMCDETGFVTKGKDSVGGARQQCGTLGKVETCQVGVVAGYASRQGQALVDKRGFLPEAWFTDVYAARRVRGQGPTAVTFQSQAPLAAAMVQAIAHDGLLPCKDLGAAGLQGHSPDVWDAVEAGGGVTAFVAPPAETRCWLQRPRTADTTYPYKREGRSKRIGVAADTRPCTGAPVAARLPASRWQQRRGSAGTTGPLTQACARQRVTLCQEGLPGRSVWLVSKRTGGTEPPYAYYLRHAPVRPPLRPLVWLSGLRWAVEQCFEEGKTELGMAHYAVRQYPGWHPHRLMTMLAHFFLWPLKLRWGKQSASTDGIARAAPPGRGLTLTHVYRGDRPRSGGVGAPAESSRLSCAPQTTGG